GGCSARRCSRSSDRDRPVIRVRLEQRRPRCHVVRTLLSFEGSAARVAGPAAFSWGVLRARAYLENSIATSTCSFRIKRIRAHGGCLGAKSRCRTWAAAISPGEVLTEL